MAVRTICKRSLGSYIHSKPVNVISLIFCPVEPIVISKVTAVSFFSKPSFTTACVLVVLFVPVTTRRLSEACNTLTRDCVSVTASYSCIQVDRVFMLPC